MEVRCEYMGHGGGGREGTQVRRVWRSERMSASCIFGAMSGLGYLS